MKNEFQKGEIIIYTSEDGTVSLDTKLENETIWLTQDMMAKLFETTVPNINMHIKNIYEEQELEENRTIKKFLIVQNEGSRTVSRNITHYNLDMILSVGYRIKSKTATKFRIWATNVLKEYLTKGYSINNKMLEKQKEKTENLKQAISLISRSMKNQIKTFDEAQNTAKILESFSQGLDLLDDFDHKMLDTKGSTIKEAVIISKEEYLSVIDKMKSEFNSDVFANPKDKSFSSSINQIYQTFGGQDCYPTLEEKAAMLLYLITKNHSFSDGNKRIAASCFLYFLDKNNMLYKNNLPIIDSATLFTLTLLIAESNPKEMDIMKQIVVSVLNKGHK
ncbi:virulence protein RhuM/Fic/DOC family protein [bacterium]|nr:virulence protein RhuM/Fic/DOC family protein [bacterium]